MLRVDGVWLHAGSLCTARTFYTTPLRGQGPGHAPEFRDGDNISWLPTGCTSGRALLGAPAEEGALPWLPVLAAGPNPLGTPRLGKPRAWGHLPPETVCFQVTRAGWLPRRHLTGVVGGGGKPEPGFADTLQTRDAVIWAPLPWEPRLHVKAGQVRGGTCRPGPGRRPARPRRDGQEVANELMLVLSLEN